jgi:hypothetical protein
MSSGILSAISFAKESTWGTPVTPTKSISVHTSDGLTVNRPAGFPTGIKGTLAKNNSGSYKKVASYSGEYEVDVIPGYAAYLFQSAIGTDTPTLIETGVYKHAFTETAAKSSLTVEQAQSEIVQRFAGVMATGFKITAKTDEPIVVNFGLVAKSVTTATAITPAYETANPLTFLGADLKIATVSQPQAENIQVEYKNGLELKTALNGSIDPSYNFVKPSEVTGSFDLYLDNTSAAQYTAYLNKTVQALSLTITGSDLIGATKFMGITVALPAVVYTAVKEPISDDMNLISVNFEAILDQSTGKLLNVDATNTLATLV